VLVPLVAALVAAVVVGPWLGVVVLVLLAAMRWRPRLRGVLVLGPAIALAVVTVYVVYLQHHFQFPAVFEWPTLFPWGRPLGWLAVVFLAVDVRVERTGGPLVPPETASSGLDPPDAGAVAAGG